jgi:hypothetical protein
MHKRAIATALFICASAAQAEPTAVVIPGKSWMLTYDIGLVINYEADMSDDEFQYMARSNAFADTPSTILSFFLEREAAQSKEVCYQHFWKKAASNPLIDKASVKHSSHEKYEQVIYKYLNGLQNANYYFVNDGYCADVHISLTKPILLSEEIVSGYGKALRW